jgi:mycofactocin system glycosyltransferase
MKGFGFSLAEGNSLEVRSDGFFLVSRLPVRLLRVNEPLFRLLRYIRDGGELSDFTKENPGLDAPELLNLLISLAAAGYLKLERIAELKDYPFVSIIVPVRDQTSDLADCLASLGELDYPEERRETIVVDDGSKKDVSRILTSDKFRIIRLEKSRGPAAARNAGAGKAGGDILAFLDADCVAGERWLRETVTFFNAGGIGAVGGRVEGYHNKCFLDRYEAAFSSLNMGNRLILEGKSNATFYVPTANMLARRDVFQSLGGFREDMRTGEDVDFCWRLRDSGRALLYTPFGAVAHKHRRRLDRMLTRRAQYGMSEAPLYRTHREKKKTLSIPVFSGLELLAIVLAILLVNPYPLCAVPLFCGLNLWRRTAAVKKLKIDIGPGRLAGAVLRGLLSFGYFAFFHLVRYYLILFIGFGVLWYPLWILGGLALVYASTADYLNRRPALFYPVFFFYFLLEQLAYQAGVFWGCLKKGYFGSYVVSFRIK